jgi:hypothetical protein
MLTVPCADPESTPTVAELAERVANGPLSAFAFRGVYTLEISAPGSAPNNPSTGGGGPIVSVFDAYEVVLSGPRRLYRYGPRPGESPVNPRRQWVAFDGQKGIEALFFVGRPELTRSVNYTSTIPVALRQPDFLLHVTGFELFREVSLASLLKSPSARVDGQEEIAGRTCWRVVVEDMVPPGLEGKNRVVVCLDPVANYLPAKVSFVPNWLGRTKKDEVVTLRNGDLNSFMKVEEWGTVSDHSTGEGRPFPRTAVVAMRGSPMMRLRLVSAELNGVVPTSVFEPEQQATTTIVDMRRPDGQGGFASRLVGGAEAEPERRKLREGSRLLPARANSQPQDAASVPTTEIVDSAGKGLFFQRGWPVVAFLSGLLVLGYWVYRVFWSRRVTGRQGAV